MLEIIIKIGKAATLLAATSSMLFAAGCTEPRESQDEFEERLTRLEDALKALEDKYNEGFLVTSVESVDGGYIINFSGDNDPITITHGTTPTIVVNAAGEVFVNGRKLEDVNLMGKEGVSPRIKVEKNEAGELRIYYTLSTAEIPTDEEWIDLGVDLNAAPADGPLSAIEINDADGTVTFVMNDEEQTRLTFTRASNAQSLAVLAFDAIRFDGSEDVELRFRVNPSTAWIPTGTGAQIEKWMIDEIEATRASYANKSTSFKIASVLPDGDKTGQYVATIDHEFFAGNIDLSNYLVALVLNNNKGDDPAADVLVSSSPFRFIAPSLPRLPTLSSLINRGDHHANGTNSFLFIMTDIDWNQQGYSGSQVTIDFTTPALDAGPRDRFLALPAGTYDCNGEEDGFSVHSLTVRKYENGRAVSNQKAASGTMTIEGDASNYTITFNTTLANGEPFFAQYVGAITIENPDYWPFDIENLQFTHAGGTYYGDEYGAGTSYFYFVLTDFDPFDRVNNTGTRLSFDLVVPQVDDSPAVEFLDMPAGTYPLAGSKAPGTIVIGEHTNLIAYIDGNEGAVVPVTGGSVTVAGDRENYTITVDVSVEGLGNIRSIYTGAMEMKNPNYWPYAEAEMTLGSGSYNGAARGDGTSSFNLGLATFDQRELSSWNGEGVQLTMELISNAIDDSPGAVLNIPAGTYTFDKSGRSGTVMLGESTVFIAFVDYAATKAYPVTGGTLTVGGDSANYNITFDIEVEGGNRVRGSYSAPLDIPNPQQPPASITFDTFAQMTMKADYSYGTDTWTMTAYDSSGVYVDGSSLLGTGWVIQGEIYAWLMSGSTLPDGEYPLSSYNFPSPDTVRPGRLDTNGNRSGTWAYRLKNSETVEARAITGGKFTSSYSGGKYTIEIDAVDSDGNTLTGTIRATP